MLCKAASAIQAPLRAWSKKLTKAIKKRKKWGKQSEWRSGIVVANA
jgi:hypothetical protein